MSIDLYLNQNVQIFDPAGRDVYAKRQNSTARSIKVRWQSVTKTIKNEKGEDLMVDAILYAKATESIIIGALVSSTDEVGKFRVLTVKKKRGIDGKVNHLEVWMQKVAL